jgi:predicted transcriptional regulator
MSSVLAYAVVMAMLPKMLEHDRRRAGWSVGQAAWRLGVSPAEYRELEAGARSPNFETWDRICQLYAWPQTFSRARS